MQAGELYPKYPGVYAFGRPDLTQEGRRLAAVKACGPEACLSHATAAAHRGMRRTDSAFVDISLPAGRPIRRLEGIRCHRANLAPQDVSEHDGIPCTSVSRILLELSTKFGDDTVASAANEAEVLEIFDMREMEDLISRSKGQRGVRRLRQVLERGDLSGEDRPKSGLEKRFARLCARGGLPKPGINRWLLLGDVYREIDFLWRRERVAIEVDSKRYHSTGWKLARDAERDELLSASGYLHDRVPEDLLNDHPLEAVEVARALLLRRE